MTQVWLWAWGKWPLEEQSVEWHDVFFNTVSTDPSESLKLLAKLVDERCEPSMAVQLYSGGLIRLRANLEIDTMYSDIASVE